MFDLSTIILVIMLFMGLTSLVAYAAERRWVPRKLVDHPATYIFSLGGYIGAWTIFGAIELANTEGYTFLSYYFGTSALFLFAPLLLQPLLDLSRTFRLNSMADIFSFRYSSEWAGILVAIGILITVIPLMALQISAFAKSTSFLYNYDQAGSESAVRFAAIIFCLLVTGFTIAFGLKNIHGTSKHDGLVFAIAFQSVIKLLFIFIIGLVAVFGIFGSPMALEAWLYTQPEKLLPLNNSLSSNHARTLILIFFSAALTFPHMYHLAITENRQQRSIRSASWGFPLYLLLISLPVLPILWASQAMQADFPAYYLALAFGNIVDLPLLSLMGYICGLAAASACLGVIIVSVASIILNHLILPWFHARQYIHIYRQLKWIRSGLMISLMLSSYLVYEFISDYHNLNNISFTAYIASLQFLPGILAVFYWPRANKQGVIAGILAGFLVWSITIVLPIVSENALGLQPYLNQLFNLNGEGYWIAAAIACLGFNMLAFGIVTLSTKMTEAEKSAADLCSRDDISRPVRQKLSLASVEEFREQLAKVLGAEISDREINLALKDLNMKISETRPFALRLLRRQLESNFSGLYGTTVARMLVDKHIPYEPKPLNTLDKDIQLIEHRLEQGQDQLSGLAARLDSLRKYHRNTVENLPIGVCTVNNDGEIMMWNHSMEALTGVSAEDILGSSVSSLNNPWSVTFIDFLNANENDWQRMEFNIENDQRYFSLHKAASTSDALGITSQTILVEEVTELVSLEHELQHNQRLASIGRLAAGVAHEIGNPITGIACLAQNLKYDSEKPEITEAAKDILEQTERVSRIVQSLVEYAHAGANSMEFHPQPVQLNTCIRDAIHLLSLEHRQLPDVVSNSVHDNIMIKADPQRITQVIINILHNAIDATGESLQLDIRATKTGKHIDLEITDNGPGIPLVDQENIFDPFFTTKEAGQGTGLGLSLVYSIIEEHNGTIKVESPAYLSSGKGTRFIICLPAAEPGQNH